MLDTALLVIQHSKALRDAKKLEEEEEDEEWEDAFDEEEIVGSADFLAAKNHDAIPANCWFEDENKNQYKVWM